jgi:hypothetical protein
MNVRELFLIVCLAVSLAAFRNESSAQDPGTGTGVNVTTWQYDIGRTGQNLNEGGTKGITYGNIGSSNFGKLCSVGLDGQVFAQPLVVQNAMNHAYVVYVVTQNDTLYAIDGTNCTILNGSGTSLAPSGQYAVDCHHIGNINSPCTTIAPLVGILSTPVISFGNHTGTIYLVAETQNAKPPNGLPTAWAHYLYAVDVQTLQYTSVQIAPPSGCGFVPTASHFSEFHIQRPALLLQPTNGGTQTPYVYIAFSMMDGNDPLPNGVVFSYDTSKSLVNQTPLCFATTWGDTTKNTQVGGGVWQGAAGLAYGDDGTGGNYVYFNTGNGTFGTGNNQFNYGDSFVKLGPNTLAEAAYLTPSDQYYRNCIQTNNHNRNEDLDFGSGGVMLVPDGEMNYTLWNHMAVTGDKEGGIWFIDRHVPGGWNAGSCGTTGSCTACPINQMANGNISTYWLTPNQNTGPTIHNNPAYWESTTTGTNYLYVAPQGGSLTWYQLCNSAPPNPVCAVGAAGNGSTTATFSNGVTPSISQDPSDGSDALVWALGGESLEDPYTTTPGILYAFDALTLNQLYASTTCKSGLDALNSATKFSIPTVANHYVYVATQSDNSTVGTTGLGTFYIFGPGANRTGC